MWPSEGHPGWELPSGIFEELLGDIASGWLLLVALPADCQAWETGERRFRSPVAGVSLDELLWCTYHQVRKVPVEEATRLGRDLPEADAEYWRETLEALLRIPGAELRARVDAEVLLEALRY